MVPNIDTLNVTITISKLWLKEYIPIPISELLNRRHNGGKQQKILGQKTFHPVGVEIINLGASATDCDRYSSSPNYL